MACKKCRFKGYVVITQAKDNIMNRTLKMCPHCEDKKAYSDYVKKKYNPKVLKSKNKKHRIIKKEADVIDFLEYKRRKENEE